MNETERRFIERHDSEANTWEIYDNVHEYASEGFPVAICRTPYVAEQVALALEAWVRGAPTP